GIRDRNVTGVQTCALPIFTGVINQDFADQLRRPVDNIWREIAGLEGIQERIVLLCVDAINENPNPTQLLEQVDKLVQGALPWLKDRKSTRLNSSHVSISYA